MKLYKKNAPNWKKKELLTELKKFLKIYEDRPIKNNKGGMRFEHMFATYFILKKINPSVVIESGIYKGQSTWLIEKTLPKSKIISIDINLSQREYISKKAKYSNLDFKYQNFSKLHKKSLVFFDDHTNHIERIRQAKFFNIKNIILEDNYRPHEGDFYTISHALNSVGFNHKLTRLSQIKTFMVFFKEFLKKFIFSKHYFSIDELRSRIRDAKPNHNDYKNLTDIIDVYFEFPSMKKMINSDMNISHAELNPYNHITYLKLL